MCHCTGVPGVISTAREIRMFKDDYENTRQILRDNIISMEENILKGLNDQPEKLVATLLERFDVNGVIPVTKADIQRTMMEVFRGENSPLHDIMKALQSLKSSETTQTQMSTAHREELTYSAEAHMWSKDNHFHLVPDNFRFPSYNVSTMWELWFFGDTQKKYVPSNLLVVI